MFRKLGKYIRSQPALLIQESQWAPAKHVPHKKILASIEIVQLITIYYDISTAGYCIISLQYCNTVQNNKDAFMSLDNAMFLGTSARQHDQYIITRYCLGGFYVIQKTNGLYEQSEGSTCRARLRGLLLNHIETDSNSV